MNKIFVKSFRIKLAFFLIIAAMIPIAALEIISVHDGLRYEKHVIDSFEKDDLESQIKIFNFWLSQKEYKMESMTALFQEHLISDASLEELSMVLDLLLSQDSDILNTYYTSYDGINIVSGDQEGTIDGRNRKWYKNANFDRVSVSSPYTDALTGKQVVTFSKAIIIDEQLMGVLGADILFSDIVKSFFSPFNDISTELIALNKEMEIVYTSSNFTKEEVEHYNKVENKFGNLLTSEFVVKKNIELLDIKVMIIFDRDKLMQSTLGKNNATTRNLFMVLVALLLIIVLAFWISKKINRPIQQLEDKAKSIVEGKTVDNGYSGYKDLDEILELFEEFQLTIHSNTKSINNMRSELEDRNKTLMALNIEYEKAYNELERFSKELSVKEGEYENLVENIVDLIWSIDADGKLIYGNEKLLTMIGYDENEFVGRYLSDIVPSFRMCYGENPYSLLHSRDYEAIDLEFVDKSNEKIIMTSTSTTRIYQNDRLLSIQGVSRDVTLEKKMYHELNSRNKDLMQINKISTEMTMTDDLQSVLDLILDNVDRLFEIKIATIRFLDADGQLKVRAFNGDENELLWSKSSREVLDSHIGYAIKNRHPVVLKKIEDIILPTDIPIIRTINEGYNIAILPLSNSVSTFGALSIIAIDSIDNRILEVLSAFANSTSVALERAILFETLQDNYFKTIETLVTAMEAKNHLMQGHSNRVSVLSEYIGEKLYLSKEEVKDLYVAALLHDVGKIGLRDAVLRQDFQVKSKALSDEITADHIEIGNKILEPIGLAKRIIEGVYYHHKLFDQTGYPNETLKEVPLFSLIIGVADDIDIMMKRNKDYPLTIIEMKDALIIGSGTRYSPEIVNLMVELIDKNDPKLFEIINNEM